MLRILVAIILIYIIWRLWKKAGQSGRAKTVKPLDKPGEMVACSRCGTFVIKAEAIKNRGHYYCSESCHKLN